jgi:2-dehydropantoate 2-reductase
MKVVVVGAGALGSIVGAHLARAGEDVVFVARGERAALLRQHGIVITGLADFTVPVTVATGPDVVHTADVLLVTVKTYDTESALADLRHLCVPSVLSLQNGVLKNEQLARVFGWERVLGAAVVVAGEVLGDGAVRFTLNERFAVESSPVVTRIVREAWPPLWSGRDFPRKHRRTFRAWNGRSTCSSWAGWRSPA